MILCGDRHACTGPVFEHRQSKHFMYPSVRSGTTGHVSTYFHVLRCAQVGTDGCDRHNCLVKPWGPCPPFSFWKILTHWGQSLGTVDLPCMPLKTLRATIEWAPVSGLSGKQEQGWLSGDRQLHMAPRGTLGGHSCTENLGEHHCV